VLSGTAIEIGAQNVHWEARGAFTGEISPPMLRSSMPLGDRRSFRAPSAVRREPTRTSIAARAPRSPPASRRSLAGETLAERDANRTLEVVERQLRGALLDMSATAYTVALHRLRAGVGDRHGP